MSMSIGMRAKVETRLSTVYNKVITMLEQCPTTFTETVRVTREDIDSGIRNDALNCPVSLALKRMGYPRAKTIDSGVILGLPRNNMYQGVLPLGVTRMLNDFDNHGRAQPITFIMEFVKIPDRLKYRLPARSLIGKAPGLYPGKARSR